RHQLEREMYESKGQIETSLGNKKQICSQAVGWVRGIRMKSAQPLPGALSKPFAKIRTGTNALNLGSGRRACVLTPNHSAQCFRFWEGRRTSEVRSNQV